MLKIGKLLRIDKSGNNPKKIPKKSEKSIITAINLIVQGAEW
jgi:hypothetical protein